jgi:hypothetical protein
VLSSASNVATNTPEEFPLFPFRVSLDNDKRCTIGAYDPLKGPPKTPFGGYYDSE